MKKTLWIGGGLLALVLAGGTAYAAMGHGGPHGMRMMKHMISARIEDAEDYIQATPQQRVAIEQSKEVIFKALASRQHPDHAKLVGILTADKLDTDALYAIANQHASDIQDLAKVIVPEIQKVHDVLTPAQRQKLADKAKQMHQHRMQGGFGGPQE
ncbi:MAG: Spy/CpxP family protein refolding chaperone [Myxococcales bacterium]